MTGKFFTPQELIEAFDLSGINRANSIFNYVPGDSKNWTDPKAIHFNATYLRTMDLDSLIPYVKEDVAAGRPVERFLRQGGGGLVP